MREWSKTAYQKISAPAVALCVGMGITAKQVTLFNHFLTLTFGCYFFAQGDYLGGILGLGVCVINGLLDYLDGDLARKEGSVGRLGVWLDSGFDVVVQNAVMGAIGLGCISMGLPIIWVVIFLISNSANNFVSFNYNATFGFDSDKGNELFRNSMDKKRSPLNVFLKNMVDPTSTPIGLVGFTYRYWIAFGMVFNIMPFCFVVITAISTFKWMVMYFLYALHLAGENRLHILKVLAILDEERSEFYSVRSR